MAGDSLRAVRSVLAHRQLRRIMLFGWLVPACSVAPEALAAPYASHIGEPVRVTGFLLMAIPAGTVLADLVAARLPADPAAAPPVVPRRAADVRAAGRVRRQPGAGPGPGPAGGVRTGLAWAAGLDGRSSRPRRTALRGRVLALSSSGLMFIQGAGFAFWGFAAQYAPVTVVIPAAAAAGVLVVLLFRPRPARA